MNRDRMLFRASRNLWGNTIDVGIGAKGHDGKVSIAVSMSLVTLEANELAPDPVLRLAPTEAQELIDELWSVGMRPSEGTGSAGALAATQKHLDDMQGIAIGLLRQQGVDL